MRILQVTQYFSPVYGGAAEVPYQLSKGLAKRGHEVTIYTSNHNLSWEYVNSTPEARVRPFKTWLSWVNFFITPSMIVQVNKEIKNFNVVHMHSYYSFQNVIVHHYTRKHDIPYVLQAHGTVATYFERGSLKKIFDVIWGYALLKDATKLIAVTPTEAEQYKRMGISEEKIEIVPNGIDLAEFENLPQRGQFRKKYGLDDAQKVVLYLARIHKIKGPDLLVKAFAELSKDLGDAKLVIVGPDDGYLAALKKLIRELKIEEKVLFTGPLYKNEKLQAYVDADVYVLPSSYEIFGITALEACACGTPVIVTDRCGIADIVDGQLGFVVPYDKDRLTNAILHMLADDKLRREFGEKGKLLVREKFNWEKIAEQVENIYSSCMLSNHRAQD
jgi:glycosyltransferase involved in cell wall biosynthesis